MTSPSERDPEDVFRSRKPAPVNFGLFADRTAPTEMEAKRDGAIAASQAKVEKDKGGTELIRRVTAKLCEYEFFTVDDIGPMLDEMGVPLDGATRRRVISAIVNGGRKAGKWAVVQWVTSHDPRRNGRPVMQWRVR